VRRLILAVGAAVVASTFTCSANANLSDCTNVYVLRVYIGMIDPRPQAVFADSANASSGSSFLIPATGHSDRAYQQLYATLLSDKLNQARVTIVTDGAGSCVTTGAEFLKAIELAR
jgi:hypothetical protein